MQVSYLDLQYWKKQTQSFSGLAAWYPGTMNISDSNGTPERMRGSWITANTFELIGQQRSAKV